jgi:hypothetical protein
MKQFMLILTLLLAVPGICLAHSTQGKVKVPLTKQALGIDDIAYYTERFITREKYKDAYEISRNRFYLKDFKTIEQENNTAEVFFTVMDMKEKERMFDDSMIFKMTDDGRWINTEAPEDEIYTYVDKKGFMQKYGVPAGLIGLAVYGVGSFAWRSIKRRRATA